MIFVLGSLAFTPLIVTLSEIIFFAQVTDNLDPGTPTILAGDFNTVFSRSLDHCCSVVVDTSRESSAALARLFKEVCCEDIWRYLHPSSSGFTWSRADGSLSSRIDLIGCPFAWVPSVSACNMCAMSIFRSLCFRIFRICPRCYPPWSTSMEAKSVYSGGERVF